MTARRRWRYLGVPACTAVGAAIGSVIRIANMPGDPRGIVTSPTVGGILGLLFALTVLVFRDAPAPGTRRPPR